MAALDRIVAAEITDRPAERPDDFALSAAWRWVVGRVEKRRSRTWATVLIETRFADVLRDHFGRHFELEAEEGDGRSRVRLGAPTPLDIARHLAGWGAMVEVVEPRSVRVVLARIGAELTDHYRE